MKATIIKTVNGVKVYIDEETKDIKEFFSNLDGKFRDDHWFFWSNDAKWVPDCLKSEGYSIESKENF